MVQTEQVVQVHCGESGFGSGYLIAPRLVLTASHVVPPPYEEATITLSESGVSATAVVRWRRYDGDTMDAALLEIPADRAWTPPTTLRDAFGRRPQRWGRLVTGGTEVRVSLTGFPRQQRVKRDGQQRAERHRESLVGRVRPHGGSESFEILDEVGLLEVDAGRLNAATAAKVTPWSGMSGAAVLLASKDLLLGVVRVDRRPRHGTRLAYTRSEDLLACADFRAVVREATGVEPGPEPAEFAHLLEPTPPKRELRSVTTLLRADAEVVSFHGRQDTLKELEAWCLADSDGLPSARVLTAPGGQGKTRLARQLAARLRDRGWVAGQVLRTHGDLDALRAVQHPLLLVVDYAETRPELVRELRERTAEARHPVRLLLLARSRGSWIRATGAVREIRLHALSPAPDEREHAFRTAARDLSGRLADVADGSVDWPRVADALPAGRPRGAPGAETALAVQMAALATLLRHVRDPLEEETTVEDQLLAHEERYWSDTARWSRERRESLRAEAVAAAVLCPARDELEARETLARLLPDELPSLTGDIAAWLRDLYPPSEGRYWGQLEPDRLAEYHASEQVVADSGLLLRLFARAPDHQRVQILTVLARSAVAHANENRADRADRAHDVIGQLRQVLRSVPEDVPLTAAVLRAHSDTLPEKSHVLRDYALDVARELARLCPATDHAPRALRDRAWALHHVAERHLAIGDWDDARQAADEAAAIRGQLAADDGAAALRTEWADSLLVLSHALRMAGRLRAAYDAGHRALDLFRALAEEDGDEEEERRERGLVRALINHSLVVWQLDPDAVPFDQIARSDDQTAEAVRRARELATRRPDLEPLLLPDALVARSTVLWRFQRHAETLSPSQEAVKTTRRLARENPDAYTADLTRALLGLSVDTHGSSRAESTALLEEATELLRPRARDLPRVHLSSLAQMRHNLAWDQLDSGDQPAAEESIAEAIGYRRELARGPYATELPSLAKSLHSLARVHVEAGKHHAAVERFEEALAIYAQAELPLSASDLNGQGSTALHLAYAYDAVGRPADTLTALNQALDIQRRLSNYSQLYTEDYARSLHDGSGLYWNHDRHVAVRILLRQALPHYCRHSRVNEEGRWGLASCLHDLGTSYGKNRATTELAVQALREAYELRLELAAEDVTRETWLADTAAELSRVLLATSRFPEAVRVSETEVRVRRRLLVTEPADQERPLCHALLRLADGRAMAGGTPAAWRTAVEAEELCRTLAGRPGEPPDRTAFLLSRLAGTLSLCGRHDGRLAVRALEPARRSVRLYRGVVRRAPDRQADLRWAVAVLAKALDRTGRHAEAIDVQIRRGA
ncbi:trypsin-like peptidase domain-containing protein [Streptomyces niveus]|uniref:trypsin-like peptidase domain-containing protein n=1 Tax=Streptomyces niveus TaxID=193462 RepID=UPI0036A2F62D